MNKVKFNPWLIILGSIGCSGLLITLSNTDGLYLGPVMEEFGWNRTSASLYMTIYNWVAALMQPLVGKIFEKRDMRKIMAGVIVVFTASYLWSSSFTHVWQWTVFGVIYGVCAGFYMYMPNALLVNRWFVKRNGLAMSLSGVITGIIGLFISPICQSLIDSRNWANTRIIMGLIFGIVCFALTVLFVRNSPEGLNMKPYGAEEEKEKKTEKDTKENLTGITLAQAMKSPTLYICVIYTFILCVACCFVQQISSYAGAFPVGAMAGAFALSVFNGIGIPRGPILGWIFDKCGGMWCNLLCYIVAAFGMLLLLIGGGNNEILLYIGIGCFAMLFFPLTSGTALMVGEVFGSREYSQIYSWVTTSLLVSGGVAPLIYAQIYDRTQNYGMFPIFVLIVCIVLIVLTPIIYKTGKTAREKAGAL